MPLHPMLVHFAVALLPVALLFDLGWRLRPRWMGRDAADLLWLGGTAAAILAATSGQAERAGFELPAGLIDAVARHQQAGNLTAWLAAAALLARLSERWLSRRSVPRDRSGTSDARDRPGSISGTAGSASGGLAVLRGVALVLTAGAAAAVLVAGHRGGELVHRDGLTRATVPWSEETARPAPFDMSPAGDEGEGDRPAGPSPGVSGPRGPRRP